MDHTLECEKKLERREKCGPKYIKYDIHRAPGYHTKITQRFDCTECMESMGKRISIAKNHKITCQGQGTGRFIYKKSVEYARNELWDAYTKDEKVREILDDDFNKRAIMHAHKRKGQKSLITKILSIIGLIIAIYMAAYIIAQAEKHDANLNTKSSKQPFQNKITDFITTPQNINNQLNNANLRPNPRKKKKDKNKQNQKPKRNFDQKSEPMQQAGIHKKDYEDAWENIEDESYNHQAIQNLFSIISKTIHPEISDKNTRELMLNLWKKMNNPAIPPYTSKSDKHGVIRSFLSALLKFTHPGDSLDGLDEKTEEATINLLDNSAGPTGPCRSGPNKRGKSNKHGETNTQGAIFEYTETIGKNTQDTCTARKTTTGGPGDSMNGLGDKTRKATINLLNNPAGPTGPCTGGPNKYDKSNKHGESNTKGVNQNPEQRVTTIKGSGKKAKEISNLGQGNMRAPREKIELFETTEDNKGKHNEVKNERRDDKDRVHHHNTISEYIKIVARNTLDTSTSRQSSKGGLGDSTDDFIEHMAATLSAPFVKPLPISEHIKMIVGNTLDAPTSRQLTKSGPGDSLDDFIEYLAATLGASRVKPLPISEYVKMITGNARDAPTYRQSTKSGPSDSLDDFIEYLATTLGASLVKSCPSLAMPDQYCNKNHQMMGLQNKSFNEYHKTCNNGIQPPRHNASPV